MTTRQIETALAFLELMNDPGHLYRSGTDEARRDLLLALFKTIEIRIVDGEMVTDPARSEASSALREARHENREKNSPHFACGEFLF
jgi:hypothetical protein